MLSSTSRLLRVLSLLQTRSHWAGAELAERLEIHPRTLRRDIDRLRELGYTVDAVRGVSGGYQLRAGGTLQREDIAADGLLGDADFFGGARKTAAFDDGQERPELT